MSPAELQKRAEKAEQIRKMVATQRYVMTFNLERRKDFGQNLLTSVTHLIFEYSKMKVYCNITVTVDCLWRQITAIIASCCVDYSLSCIKCSLVVLGLLRLWKWIILPNSDAEI